MWSHSLFKIIVSRQLDQITTQVKMNIIFIFLHICNAKYLKLYSQDKEYFYIGKNLNWADARKSCHSNNGELAQIRDENENEKIGNFLCQVHRGCKNWNLIGGVWIGYYLEQNENFIIKTTHGLSVDQGDYLNIEKKWSVPAYDYQEDSEHSGISDLGNGIIFDYDNWDLPPLCYQINYEVSTREFKWIQNNCSTKNGVLCERTIPALKQKITSINQSSSSSSNEIKQRSYPVQVDRADNSCSNVTIDWRNGARSKVQYRSENSTMMQIIVVQKLLST